MSNGIVIIGSGFAARQLVKNIRKQDATSPLTLIAADSMDEYNKPDLSHVISQGQRADDLTRQTAGEFAEQFNLHLKPLPPRRPTSAHGCNAASASGFTIRQKASQCRTLHQERRGVKSRITSCARNALSAKTSLTNWHRRQNE